jgi:hypothetical protein
MIVCRVGLVASEAVTPYKLMQYGFKREWFALFALFEFPFEILFVLWVGRLNQSRHRILDTWLSGYKVRLAVACVAPLFVLWASLTAGSGGPSYLLMGLVYAAALTTSLGSNMFFVSQSSFFAQISDSSIGGAYVTLLNTVANFGAAWPRFFIMAAVDTFSDARCQLPGMSAEAFASAASCVTGAGKAACLATEGAKCVTVREGYFPVVCIGIGLGAALLLLFRKHLLPLQHAQESDWRPQIPVGGSIRVAVVAGKVAD